MEERENDGEERVEEEGKERREDEEEHKKDNDLEKGEVGVEERVGKGSPEGQRDFHVSMLQRLNPSNPLRVAIPGMNRGSTPSPAQPRSISTPTPQVRATEKPRFLLG